MFIGDLRLARNRRRRTAHPLGEVDRQRGGAILVCCLLDRHWDAGIVVFKAGEAVAPKVAGTLVAVVDFACICEVEAGHGWEFFVGRG